MITVGALGAMREGNAGARESGGGRQPSLRGGSSDEKPRFCCVGGEAGAVGWGAGAIGWAGSPDAVAVESAGRGAAAGTSPMVGSMRAPAGRSGDGAPEAGSMAWDAVC